MTGVIEARRGATAPDVVSAYRVILGREPESAAVVAGAVGQPLAAVVPALVASGEFEQGVVRALVNGHPPADRFPGVPGADDRSWAATRLGLTPEGEAQVAAAQGWPELLLALFSDAAFGPWTDGLELAWERPAFLEALAAWTRTPLDAGSRDDDWGDSIAERDAAMKRDVAERLQLTGSPAGSSSGSRPTDGPLISVLVPLYDSPLEHLASAIQSVRRQSYPNWELILVDDGSPKPTVAAVASAFAALDDRVRFVALERNGGIAAASNAGLAVARGAFLALLDHDDMLTVDALEAVAEALRDDPALDLIYSDEALIDTADRPRKLFAKPDWSPLLMLGMHYIGHLTVHRTARVREVGGFRSAYDFSQDYDLALRVMERAPRVRHIDRILYGWRMVEGSAAAGGKDFARRTNIAALQDALDRRGWEGFAEALPRSNRARRRPRPSPPVALVIPSDDAGHIRAAVASIREHTWYEHYEIRVVTTSSMAARLRGEGVADVVWVPYDRPFNFSDKCNEGVRDTQAEFVAFFNDDVRVLTPDWIEALLEVATLPGVGAVAPKLLYEDGTIQHAGMVTGVRRLVGTAFHSRPADTHDWFNLGQTVRECSLLCGALMMMRREVFLQLDGFDAVAAPVSHSDVDLCLRVREAGLSCVYTPHAVLTHIGHQAIGAAEAAAAETPAAAPRRRDKADIHLLRRFPEAVAYDPFYPPAARGLDFRDSETRFALHPGAGLRPEDGAAGDVLIVTGELSGTGGPKVVLDMARAFREAGRFVVVATARDGVMRPRLTAEGVPVIVDARLLSGDAWVRDLGRGFDLVVANTAVTWPVVEALGGETDVRWYFHEVDLVARLARDRPGFAPALRRARELWTGSRLGQEALEAQGVAATVVPYGVDDAGERPPHGAGPVRVGVFGTYEPRKGQDLALAAWTRLPPELRRGAELVFWGRVLFPDHHAALVEAARGLDDVRIEGELSHAEYMQALAGCDIVWVPSRDDTLPLVSLDALSAGRVLACSRRVGTAAHLEPGVSGLVARAPGPDLLAASLAPALADPALRARVGAAGRAVFEREFTHAAFRRRLRDLVDPAPSPSRAAAVRAARP